jgi:branched-chain amino acid transport system permease protein
VTHNEGDIQMELLQALINGVLIGGVYALIGVGLTLVFGVMDIVNFAQAEFMMLGMYVAFFLFQVTGIDPILSSLIVFGVVFLIGALVQKGLIQRVMNAPMVSQIFLTVGLTMVLVSTTQLLFGATFRSVTTAYQMLAFHLGPLQFSVPYLIAFGVSITIYFFLWLFLERTDLGRSMRATAQNRSAAILVGINDKQMYVLAMGLGTGLAASAGAVILPYAYVFPTVGHQYALIMFTTVVLGGFGSVPGALLGGIIVGIIQSVSSVYLPTQLQNLVVFIVFIITLVYKPAGLLGR